MLGMAEGQACRHTVFPLHNIYDKNAPLQSWNEIYRCSPIYTHSSKKKEIYYPIGDLK